MRSEFLQKIILLVISMGQSTVRFSPKKNNTDTETLRLVYNEFKFDLNYADKTRR